MNPTTRTARKTPSQFDYIRDYYGIAIDKGMHVTDRNGRRGVIVGATSHDKVQMEGVKANSFFHPEALAYPALDYVGKEITEARSRRVIVESPDAAGIGVQP